MKTTGVRMLVASAVAGASMAVPSSARAQDAGAKTLIDYFLPTPIVCPLTSNTWGAASVLPRDTCNGLEDTTGTQWTYWDGVILKNTDGTYHMFAGRWPASKGFNDWPNSVGVHAVSNAALMGSYVPSTAATFTSGKEQNVTGITLNDGSYALIDSPGNIFTATSLDGPWTSNGAITISANGYTIGTATENQSLWQMATGDFLIAPRPFYMMLSTAGILGPYLIQGGSILPTIPGLSGQAEDPVIWCSGGQYHMVANWWSARKAMHLTSDDGIHNWVSKGLAYDPTADFVRYTDGTINHWYNMERPGVVMDNGHVAAFTFAVTDVEKTTIVAGDNHLSKIIVVPFDGVTFDLENPGPGSAGCPIGSVGPVDAGLADANPAVDAGVVRDAAPSLDAGASDAVALDAGSPTDSGQSVDAGRVADASVSGDAAAPTEAGRVADATSGIDAVTPQDGAVAMRDDVVAPEDAAASQDSPVTGALDGQGGLPDEGGVPSNGGDASTTASGGNGASGCSCQTAGHRGANGGAAIAALVGLAFAIGRRRRGGVAASPESGEARS